MNFGKALWLVVGVLICIAMPMLGPMISLIAILIWILSLAALLASR